MGVMEGQKVMLSADLAELYQVELRALVQAVKRNMDRFPRDFMFQLNKGEFSNLKSQIVTSTWGGLRRARPCIFVDIEVYRFLFLIASEAVEAIIPGRVSTLTFFSLSTHSGESSSVGRSAMSGYFRTVRTG